MYLKNYDKTLLHIPRTGGTSIIRSARGDRHSQTFINRREFEGKTRHPRVSELDIKGELVVVVRNPVERYKSIKRFVMQRAMSAGGG